MPEVIETGSEFADRHGGRGIELGGRILFPDGASCDMQGWVRFEPPADPAKRLSLRRDFWTEKVRRSEADFRALKNALTGTGSTFRWRERDHGPVQATEQSALLRLKTLVDEARATLAEINAEIDQLPEHVLRREHAARDRAIAEQNAVSQSALRDELLAIEI